MTAQPLAPTTLAAARRPVVVTVALILMVLSALPSLLPAPGTEEIPQFILISANLATSEVEVVQNSVSHGPHLAGIRPLIHGVTS